MRRLIVMIALVAAPTVAANTVPAGAADVALSSDDSVLDNTDVSLAAYVKPEAIMLQRLLPPPPEPNSAAQRDDMAAVEAGVASRTAADEVRMKAQKPCAADAFAGDLLGSDFTRQRVPLTFALIKNACRDALLAVNAAKAAFARQRPYMLDPRLSTFGRRSETGSYPSGHATFGRLMAVILAAMVPDKAAALFARGDLYGHNRLLAGDHFPSDLAAGATAGSVIAAALFNDVRFRADFGKAAAETRAALGAPVREVRMSPAR